MPYVPIALQQLLVCPRFSPFQLMPTLEEPSLLETRFIILAKSIMFQIISAVAYLHDHNTAHRDVKRHNFHLTMDGCVKLLDFGVSRIEGEDSDVVKHDLWPEYPGKLYFEVSTRQVGMEDAFKNLQPKTIPSDYSAPELFFGPTSYDTLAIDLWSLGATLADFFTHLEPDADSDDNVGIVWVRHTLFESPMGSLGCLLTIFRRRGTPTEDNWPVSTFISPLSIHTQR